MSDASDPPPDKPGDVTDDEASRHATERRDDARTPIALKVEYRRLNSFFADYTRNISKGGTFIATARPLPVGTEFVFQLQVPSLEQPLELRGKVAWVVTPEQSTSEQAAGMGIRFQHSTDEERRAVHRTVEQLMKQSLGPALSHELLGDITDRD